VTSLFTDVEGSTCLWEAQPAGMHDALARGAALEGDAVLVYALAALDRLESEDG